MTKIAVLDGYTLNPGDLSWDTLNAIGQVQFHERTDVSQIVERCKDVEFVLTNKVPFSKETIAQLPNLKYIGVTATGTNIIDIDACKANNITVTNAPGYSSDSVAQHVFALILSLTSLVDQHSTASKSGDWANCQDFSFTLNPIHELAGKTLGIVGLGGIGKKVAKIASAFGMNIAAAHQSSMDRIKMHGIKINWLPHEELFQQADIITLHCPLTDSTNQLINQANLSKMKKSAILINTGRGQIIDEAALANALNNQEIAGAGLDVLSSEPPQSSNPLLSAKNCAITPHIAWASVEARTRLMNIVCDNINAYLSGNPSNVVG